MCMYYTIQAQWTADGSDTSTSIISYTELQFDCSPRPAETTTTASPETTVPPGTTYLDENTTATNGKQIINVPRQVVSINQLCIKREELLVSRLAKQYHSKGLVSTIYYSLL